MTVTARRCLYSHECCLVKLTAALFVAVTVEQAPQRTFPVMASDPTKFPCLPFHGLS